MKKVIYPGPAIPIHMTEGGFYPIRQVTLFRGANEIEDKDAIELLAAGHVVEVRDEAPPAPAPVGPRRMRIGAEAVGGDKD